MRLSLFIGIFLSLNIAYGQIVAPDNFYRVDNSVLRGAALTADNVKWLKNHNVKTIIKLDDENMDELNWGIPVEAVHINKFGLNLNYEMVVEILERIQAAKSIGSVYVHCEHGADRTGLIIALYRITQGWSIEQARDEMNAPRFGHSSLQVWIDYKFEEYSKRIVEDLSY